MYVSMNYGNNGSDNGLSCGQHQAIIWTIACLLSVEILGTNLSEILIEIQTFLFKKINLKISFGKWWPFCLILDHLTMPISLMNYINIKEAPNFYHPWQIVMHLYWPGNLNVKMTFVGLP